MTPNEQSCRSSHFACSQPTFLQRVRNINMTKTKYCEDVKCVQKYIADFSCLRERNYEGFPTWAGEGCQPFWSISSLTLSLFFLRYHLCFDLVQQQELHPGKKTFKRIFHSTSIVLLVTNDSLPSNQLCPLLYCGWWTAAADDREMKAVAHFCRRRLCCPADENFHLPVCVSNQN